MTKPCLQLYATEFTENKKGLSLEQIYKRPSLSFAAALKILTKDHKDDLDLLNIGEVSPWSQTERTKNPFCETDPGFPRITRHIGEHCVLVGATALLLGEKLASLGLISLDEVGATTRLALLHDALKFFEICWYRSAQVESQNIKIEDIFFSDVKALLASRGVSDQIINLLITAAESTGITAINNILQRTTKGNAEIANGMYSNKIPLLADAMVFTSLKNDGITKHQLLRPIERVFEINSRSPYGSSTYGVNAEGELRWFPSATLAPNFYHLENSEVFLSWVGDTILQELEGAITKHQNINLCDWLGMSLLLIRK